MNHDHNTNLLNDQEWIDTQGTFVVEHPLTISQQGIETHAPGVDGHLLLNDHYRNETQNLPVVEHPLTISLEPTEIQRGLADGHLLLNDQPWFETHGEAVVEHPLTIGQRSRETHSRSADGHLLLNDQSQRDTHSRPVVEHSLTISQRRTETQVRSADGHLFAGDGEPPIPTAKNVALPISHAPSGWDELRLCAELFNRLQTTRIAMGNMLTHTDSDLFAPMFADMMAAEKKARKHLRDCYRRVVPPSLRQMQINSRGLGEDMFARILGHLGDPYVAIPHWWLGKGDDRVLMQGEPYVRTIGQLWQYAGHGAPSRRTKNMSAEALAALGSPMVKKLIYMQADCCVKVKGGGPYRDIYDEAKAAAEDNVHSVECVRCGPSGKPKQPGTPWSKGHKHAHALRIVGKHILRDMWLARYHEEGNQ